MVRGRRLGIRGLDDGWLGIGIDREGWGEEDHRCRPMCRCRRLRRGTPSRRGEVSRVRSAGPASPRTTPALRSGRTHCQAAQMLALSPPPPRRPSLSRPPLPTLPPGRRSPHLGGVELGGSLAASPHLRSARPHRLHSALPTARPPPPPPHSSPPVAALSPTYSGRSSPISCLLAWGRAIIHRGEEERERVIG